MSKTIFFIHGMWGGPWYWENYRQFFSARGYTCHATTLRYHNIQPQDTPDPRLGTTSLLDYAADLEAEIRELPERPIIIGHSMGGLLTMMLASRGLPAAAVCLTPASPVGVWAITPSVTRSFWSVLTRWGFWRKPMRQTYKEAVYSMLQRLSPEEQRATYARFVYESGRAAAEIGFWFFDRRRAAAVEVSRITCPMLIIAAGQDRITPPFVERQIARKLAGIAEYKEYPDHAHWIMAEPGWEKVAEDIAQWLKER